MSHYINMPVRLVALPGVERESSRRWAVSAPGGLRAMSASVGRSDSNAATHPKEEVRKQWGMCPSRGQAVCSSERVQWCRGVDDDEAAGESARRLVVCTAGAGPVGFLVRARAW